MCCGLVLKIPFLAIAMYLFYRRTVFLKHSSLFHSQASRWYFLVCKGELVALTSLFQAWYNMIQSQPYSKDTPLILAILNSDFGWISLRKTVIAVCSASFTSEGKVSRTSDSIFGSKFWLVLQKTRALEQSYMLEGYILLILLKCVNPEYIHTSPTDGQWNFRRGWGAKKWKFSNGRGGPCGIIFPEGHAKLTIIEHVFICISCCYGEKKIDK